MRTTPEVPGRPPRRLTLWPPRQPTLIGLGRSARLAMSRARLTARRVIRRLPGTWARSDLGHRDSAGVADCLGARAVELAEWGVGDRVGVDSGRLRVFWVQSLDQVLRGEDRAGLGGHLDSSALVHLVAQRRDLEAAAGGR